MSQCMHTMIHKRHRKVLGKSCPIPDDLSVDALADHITRFSLAGIREVRRRIEARG